jgi:hypothetical protein
VNELSDFARECAKKIKHSVKGLVIEDVNESRSFVQITIDVHMDNVKLREVDVAQAIFDTGISIKFLGCGEILIEKPSAERNAAQEQG